MKNQQVLFVLVKLAVELKLANLSMNVSAPLYHEVDECHHWFGDQRTIEVQLELHSLCSRYVALALECTLVVLIAFVSLIARLKQI